MTTTVILANFRKDPFGRLIAEHLSDDGFDLAFSEDLSVLETSPVGDLAGGLHTRSWNARKQGISFPLVFQSSLDFDHLLASCDRIFLQPQPVSDILGYLGSLGQNIANWLSSFPSSAPVVFLSTPHFPPDLVLALLAQATGHPTFVVRTSLVDEHVWFGRLSGTQVSAIAEFATETTIRQQMGNGVPVRLELSRKMNVDLAKRREGGNGRLVRRFWRRICRIFLPDKLNIFLGIQPLRRGPTHYWSYLGRYKMMMVRAKFRLRVIQNRHFLNQLQSQAVPERYIYVPLHFQPERSTNPEGGSFRNQIRMVSELSTFVVENPDLSLVIVVREHPRQNSGDIRQIHERDRQYYETLRSIPGVMIVSSDIGTDNLIAKASLVVSVNGSSSWEALEAGTAALTGVYTWHSSCPASPNWASVRGDPQRLRDLVIMTREEVLSHLSEFLDSPSFLVRGSISHKHLANRGSFHDVAASMAAAISQIVRGDRVKWREVP